MTLFSPYGANISFISMENIMLPPPPKKVNQPGEIDLSFGTNGSTSVEGGPLVDIAVVTSDGPHQGKIVGLVADNNMFKLFRLHKDGQLDMEFGTDLHEGKRTGYTTQGFGNEGSKSTPNKLTLMGDKKILVTGQVDDKDIPFTAYPAAALFNFSGSSNPVFAKNGVFILKEQPPKDESPQACSPEMTDLPPASRGNKNSDTILFYSRSSPARTGWGVLIRLTPNGELDTTFNRSGYVFFRHPGGASAVHSVVTQRDGTIIVAGVKQTEGFLAAFHPDGSIKLDFGTDGFITLKSEEGSMEPRQLLLRQSDDALIVVGWIDQNQRNACIIRTLAKGMPDPAFNHGKPVVTDGKFLGSLWQGGALDSQGSIVAAGEINYLRHGLVGRITENGTEDPTFGTDGYSDPYAVYMPTAATCIAVQTDTTLVIGARQWSSRFSVSRIHT
jgi:uncharacterized delta-60 repeat protein